MLEPAAACNPRAAGDAQDDQTGHQEVETGGDVLTRWSAAVLKTSRSGSGRAALLRSIGVPIEPVEGLGYWFSGFSRGQKRCPERAGPFVEQVKTEKPTEY